MLQKGLLLATYSQNCQWHDLAKSVQLASCHTAAEEETFGDGTGVLPVFAQGQGRDVDSSQDPKKDYFAARRRP